MLKAKTANTWIHLMQTKKSGLFKNRGGWGENDRPFEVQGRVRIAEMDQVISDRCIKANRAVKAFQDHGTLLL